MDILNAVCFLVLGFVVTFMWFGLRLQKRETTAILKRIRAQEERLDYPVNGIVARLDTHRERLNNGGDKIIDLERRVQMLSTIRLGSVKRKAAKKARK